MQTVESQVSTSIQEGKPYHHNSHLWDIGISNFSIGKVKIKQFASVKNKLQIPKI